jgi:hypothetical protein
MFSKSRETGFGEMDGDVLEADFWTAEGSTFR